MIRTIMIFIGINVILAGFVFFGIVGIHYPILDDYRSPFTDPVHVAAIHGDVLLLDDGRQVRHYPSMPAQQIRTAIESSEFYVEILPLEIDRDGIINAIVKVPYRTTGYCGTPYCQGIRIPLIPDHLRVYRLESIDRFIKLQPLTDTNREYPIDAGNDVR